jgi:hypothetical protein
LPRKSRHEAKKKFEFSRVDCHNIIASWPWRKVEACGFAGICSAVRCRKLTLRTDQMASRNVASLSKSSSYFAHEGIRHCLIGIQRDARIFKRFGYCAIGCEDAQTALIELSTGGHAPRRVLSLSVSFVVCFPTVVRFSLHRRRCERSPFHAGWPRPGSRGSVFQRRCQRCTRNSSSKKMKLSLRSSCHWAPVQPPKCVEEHRARYS